MGKRKKQSSTAARQQAAIAVPAPVPGRLLKDGPHGFLVIVSVASAVLLAKLILSYHVYGTNDMTYWLHFADVIKKFGTFKIYGLVPIYNHPPLMSWILKLVNALQGATALSFPFLFRLLPVFADYGSIFVVWALLKKYGSDYKTVICILCSVNPINFLVSGFHGNTDPVFGFFILLAVYFMETDACASAGLMYGVSLCFKIVPALLMPAFFFYARGIRKKIAFVLAAAVAPAVVFIPYVVADHAAVIKNIFHYSSLKGIWGAGHALRLIFQDETISADIRKAAFDLFKLHVSHAHIFVFAVILFLSFYFLRKRRVNLTEGVFLVFVTFLAVSPGFGVQYLAWPSFLSFMVMPALGALYGAIGGLFLYRVYAYWGGLIPPYYANSDTVGQWVGVDKTIDLVLWAVVVVMAVVFLVKHARATKKVAHG